MATIKFEVFGLKTMAELFLELFSEEIPARLQFKAQENLKMLINDELVKAKSHFEAIETFSTPRRLIMVITGLSDKTISLVEDKRGPNVLASQQAIDGFCKSMKVDQSKLFIKDEKKGKFFYMRLETRSQNNSELLPEIITKVLERFPWPKSMRWGSGTFKWVRPLRSVICLLSNELETKVLSLKLNGINSNNVSYGHRFLSPDEFSVSSFENYKEQMRQRFVMIDRQLRKEKIRNDASNAAFAVGLELVEDNALLEEVTGLVEWPEILIGKVERTFLTLPSEVLQVSMREHQKFFSLKNKDSDTIDSFIIVSNISSKDNGKRVVQGNERVLRARLSDAKFFWENDLRRINLNGYEAFSKKLTNVIFHNKLGSEFDRVKRITDIAGSIALLINADAENTKIAASLCKLDLVSEMVYEFPELQGIIGQYYALKAGFNKEIAYACSEHYLPKGPLDDVPQRPISISLALADKIDLISNFWSINFKPTGSKDPFALRRAAIGIIRILLENKIRLSLPSILKLGNKNLDFEDLINFFSDRLRGQLIEKGLRSDVLNSLNLKTFQNISLIEIVQRAWVLQAFVATERGKDLIQGYKRAVNILTAEENKDSCGYLLYSEIDLLEEPSERSLNKNLLTTEEKIGQSLKNEKINIALEDLSKLRVPIDKFFNDVKINSENSALRRNRLYLLNQIKNVMHMFADFSQIDGDL